MSRSFDESTPGLWNNFVEPEKSGDDLRTIFDCDDIQDAINQFQNSLLAGGRPRIDDFIVDNSHNLQSQLIEELVLIEVEHRLNHQEPLTVEEYLRRFPALLERPQFVERLTERLQRTSGVSVTGGTSRESEPPLPQQNEPLLVKEHLLGFIAEQSGLINREQLLAALNVWLQNKHRKFSEILTEQNAVNARDCERLEKYASTFLAQNVSKGQSTIGSATESKSGLKGPADSNLKHTLGGDQTSPQPQRSGIFPATHGTAGRFQILRPHARGGLGEVFIAIDTELNREVALKEIRSGFGGDERNRERFIREAEITGRLEHPSIVPVYGLGAYADGRPYYAMRFIHGHSMDEAIKNFHKSNASEREKSLKLRQLLQRFIAICDAMQYAHDRGVLHRDLKPANIMMGRYGETLVVDWGIAKPLGKNEENSPEMTLLPAAVNSEDTLPGSTIGTPSYMSPEQAAGRISDLSVASDVYSLGATLYHLLTGEPAFKGPIAKVLKQVMKGRFTSPHEKNPQIPKALDGICLKAMSLKPADRYPSARSLAADIERWLADEPVSVLTESASDRLARFGRKHRDVVSTLLVSMLLIAIGSIVAAVMINHERKIAVRLKDEISGKNEENIRKNEENIRLANDKAKLADENSELAEHYRQKADENKQLAEENDKIAKRQTAERERAEALAEEKTQLANALSQQVIKTEDARKSAQIALEQAQRELYISQLARASSDLEDQDFGGAQHSLLNVPLQRREWEYYYLWRQSEGDALTLRGHTGAINSVCYHPTGKQLASASDDGMILIWDTETGGAKLKLQGHSGSVTAAQFSRDGQRLASASRDGTARVWDVQNGNSLLVLPAQSGAVNSVSFSPDGTLLATSENNDAKIWDAHTGKELRTLRGHTGIVNCVSFSPDGHFIATAADDEMVKGWETESGIEVFSLRGAESGIDLFSIHGNSSPIKSVSFSPDGLSLAVTWLNGTVKMCDTLTGKVRTLTSGQLRSARSASFSPDGMRLAAGGWRRVGIWDTETGAELLNLRAHVADVGCVAFSPDGQHLASGSDDGTLKIWNIHVGNGSPTFRLFSPFHLSRDGARMATHSNSDEIKLRDSRTGIELLTLRSPMHFVRSGAFSPDGRQFASGSFDETIKIWDTQSGKELGLLHGHRSTVNSVCFSPDGLRLASASADHTLRIWDARTGTVLYTLRGHTKSVNSAIFSVDGLRIISGASDRSVKVWDAKSGNELLTLGRHDGPVHFVCLCPDGTKLASAAGDGTIKIWDMESGEELFTLRGHSSSVNCVSFSPDGRRLASASDDKSVKICDVKTGDELITLRGHTSGVHTVEFCSDGLRLMSASYDGTIKTWNAQSDFEVLVLRGHRGKVVSASVRADGLFAASIAEDQIVKVWDLKEGRGPLSLEGDFTSIGRIWFSNDGTDLVFLSSAEGVAAWHLPEGTRMDAESVTNAIRPTEESSNQALQAICRADEVWIVKSRDQQELWRLDTEQSHKLAPEFHRQRLRTATQSKNWFAVAHHAKQLLCAGIAEDSIKKDLNSAEAEFNRRHATGHERLREQLELNRKRFADAKKRVGNLLEHVELRHDAVRGEWTFDKGILKSPKAPRSIIELPVIPPDAYRLTVVVEPLDEPDGLILGQLMRDRRFQIVLHSKEISRSLKEAEPSSGMECVSSISLSGGNPTLRFGDVLQRNHRSKIVCDVLPGEVTVTCDEKPLLKWKGAATDLSMTNLDHLWPINHSMFLSLGSENCSFHFHEVTLAPLNSP